MRLPSEMVRRESGLDGPSTFVDERIDAQRHVQTRGKPGRQHDPFAHQRPEAGQIERHAKLQT